MGCPTVVYLGDSFVFSICTHDPDTAISTDADFDPIWRLYEEETAVPILTGTLTLLDPLNTTGFYTDLIVASAANGFEDGKTYTIYISATVDADPGAIPYAFIVVDRARVVDEIWDELLAGHAIAGSAGAALAAAAACGLGPGAIEFIYTVTDAATGLPLGNVQVWVSTDAGAANIIASSETDAFGQVTFWLDVGTFYFWRERPGYLFVNPDIETVV